MKTLQSDVVVIGAGIAGSTAAILYANQGKKVVILDRKKRDSYKINCTHYIQPAALPTIQKLGMEETILEAGGIKNEITIYNKHGWIRDYQKDDSVYGYNIKRESLDPVIKSIFDQNENITYLNEQRLGGVELDGDTVTGIHTKGKHDEVLIKGKFFVAAGGENSKMVKLMDNDVDKVQNKRFILFTYYSGVKMDITRHWDMYSNTALCEKLSNDEILMCIFVHRSELEEWKNAPSLDEKMEAFVKDLPFGPDIANGQRISDFVWSVNNVSYYRDAYKSNVAFVGDALMKTDPVAGAGCAFAFKSTDLLFENTKDVLDSPDLLKEGLESYKAAHHKVFRSHYDSLCDITKKDHISDTEYKFFEIITNNKELSSSYIKMIGRTITPLQFQMEIMTQMAKAR